MSPHRFYYINKGQDTDKKCINTNSQGLELNSCDFELVKCHKTDTISEQQPNVIA